MLKIKLLIRAEDREHITHKLQDIGMLHLEEMEAQSEGRAVKEEKGYSEALEWLNQHNFDTSQYEAAALEGALLDKLLQLKEDWNAWLFRKSQFDQSAAYWDLWKGFDPDKWKALEVRGLAIGLYKGDEKLYRPLKDRSFLIRQDDQEYYFCIIDRIDDIEALSLDPMPAPPFQAKELNLIKLELAKKEQEYKSQIKALQNHSQKIEEEIQALVDEAHYEYGSELWKELKASPLLHLSAWLVKSQLLAFKNAAQSLAMAYRIEEPSPEDVVPVALKNLSYSKLFEPITKIFQLPHYFEFDLTPMIAVFYPILFAYCLGDAGYGAIMTLAALIAWFSFLKKQRGLAALIGVLGLSTTIMGLVKSGSLFGIALSINSEIPWIAWLGSLVIIPDDSEFFFNAFNVALLIGVFQILIGILLAIAKSWFYTGFKSSLSLWGKLLIVASSITLFMTESLKLSDLGTTAISITLGLGVLLVMLFHDLSQALFLRIGSSILPLFFIFTGLLGDVLSYVRLFALGVTSAVLGLVVNQIGLDMLNEHWWSWIAMGIFLLFGHSLNFVLAALGSFIHPLRLSFVEFYNNAQFQGGGKPFQAFKRTKIIN